MPLTEIAVKEYTAVINQFGTNAPEVTILHNTLGNIVWTYSNTGIYHGTLTGAFNSFKTFLTCAAIPDIGKGVSLIIANENYVSLITSSAGALANGVLLDTCIKIQVYNI